MSTEHCVHDELPGDCRVCQDLGYDLMPERSAGADIRAQVEWSLATPHERSAGAAPLDVEVLPNDVNPGVRQRVP